jgi:alkanesulfonate monooxygenase SsuD/methylene tetrahydromethanopterin reductase-like flavin-dependent oxidoreductase (luciferase family)
VRERGIGLSLNGFLYGTPEQAASQILEYAGDIPVDTVFFFASLANTPEDLTARHIQAICKLGKLLDTAS